MTLSITETETLATPKDKEVILSVEGVSKKFCRDLKRSLFYGVQDITTDLVGLKKSNPSLRPREFWALDNVSFQLRKGEALGLVGKNGSGKSTLLRIIAGLIKPDKGQVRVKGRVAPLIALGAGFNPILTGRENIYANMSILGLSKKQIDERFDEVVEFAEIGDAIDSPVQSYSSGMAARLGFATAIHTEPEILLIDEVLAVGDSRFRGKCFQKLHELRQNGISFILVSHDSHAILTVCESAVYLKQGEFVGFGDAVLMINKYENDLFLNDGQQSPKQISLLKTGESFGLEIQSLFFRNHHDELIKSPTTSELLKLCLKCKVNEKIDHVSITFAIRGLGKGSETILLINNTKDKQYINLSPGEFEIQLKMPYLGLKLGHYLLDVYAKKEKLYHLDAVESFRFTVEGGAESMSRCIFYQPRQWEIIDVMNRV